MEKRAPRRLVGAFSFLGVFLWGVSSSLLNLKSRKKKEASTGTMYRAPTSLLNGQKT
jgi:hypothetical protein